MVWKFILNVFYLYDDNNLKLVFKAVMESRGILGCSSALGSRLPKAREPRLRLYGSGSGSLKNIYNINKNLW